MRGPVSSAVAERPVRVDFRNQGAESAIVFVHGFGGHAEQTWGDFPRFLIETPDLGAWDLFGVGYSSSLRIDLARVWTADARLDTLGYYLRTALALPPFERYKRIALVAHSMGGLIAQQALLDEQCRARISHLFLFGTPSAGLKGASFVRSFKQQARDMVEGSEFIVKLRAAWNDVTSRGVPFTMRVIAGERDAFVPTTSSLEPFPDSMRFVVPGDHLTMVKPKDVGSLSVELVVQALTGIGASSTPPPPKNNLPRQLSRFIGREKEIAEIKELLAGRQLLTIVGPGGIGKTRTALEAAADLLDTMPDGAWFVDLASLNDPTVVPSAIAATFGIEDKGGSQRLIDTVALTLKDRTALVVLDNCEHVLNAAADAADRILRACQRICMIVTTREPLGIAGEATFRMPTLNVSESVALFAERAKAADSSFALNERTEGIVEDIVQRLDGIALAIELAAPRVKVLGVDRLAQRLDQRLKLLAGGSRTALPRQQTLRALIDWSYDLLSGAERAMLRQLAVFRGRFTLEAVTNVCEATPDLQPEWDELMLLSSLIDKSLVVTESGDDLRYRLLESTREYAFERLDEADLSKSALSRHCWYFADLATCAYNAVWVTSLEPWLAQVRGDLENYRAAIDWGLIRGHDSVTGASIVANLLHLWEQSLISEGRRLVELAKNATTGYASPILQGRIALAVATLASRDPPQPEKSALAVSILAAADDPASYADALRECARSLAKIGKWEEARSRNEEALAVAQSLQYSHLIARVLADLGINYSYTARRSEGVLAFDQATSMLRSLNDRRRLLIALAHFAELKFAEGDIPGAIADATEGVEISRDIGVEYDLTALFRANLAAYLLRAGKYGEAWVHLRDALQLALRVGGQLSVNNALQHFAHLAAVTGDMERGARIIGHVDAVFAAAGELRETTESSGYDRLMAILHDGLEDNRLISLMAKGAASEESLIIDEAMAISQPGA